MKIIKPGDPTKEMAFVRVKCEWCSCEFEAYANKVKSRAIAWGMEYYVKCPHCNHRTPCEEPMTRELRKELGKE